MACADAFTARIIGKGGHGAIPQQTIDPIVIASQIVLALQTTISRNLNPLQPAVVTVGKVWAGTAFNIIPGEAHLEGTVRTFDEGVRDAAGTPLPRNRRGTAPRLRRHGEFNYERGYPATVNDDARHRNRAARRRREVGRRQRRGIHAHHGRRRHVAGAATSARLLLLRRRAQPRH